MLIFHKGIGPKTRSSGFSGLRMRALNPVQGLSEYSILTFSELAREHQGHHQPTNQTPSERARARTFSEAVPEGIQMGLERLLNPPTPPPLPGIKNHRPRPRGCR